MNEGEALRVNRILAVDALQMNPRHRVPGNGAAGPLQRGGTMSARRQGAWWVGGLPKSANGGLVPLPVLMRSDSGEASHSAAAPSLTRLTWQLPEPTTFLHFKRLI